MFAEIQRQIDAFLTDAPGAYPEHRTHALVDGALLQQSPEDRFQRAWRALPSHSLFPASTSDSAKAFGPLLIDITNVPRQAMPSLLDSTQELCIGSYIVSRLSARELSQALSPFTSVMMADRSDMVMRFQDPRVLPSWLAHLETSYKDCVGSQCRAWMFIDPGWRLQIAEFSRGDAVATPDFPMNLSLAAQSALERDCFPHTVISRFDKEDRAALEKIPLVERYEFFRNQIVRASAHGFESFADIEIYCSLAIEFGALFDERPIFQSILDRVAAGSSLALAVANVGTVRLTQSPALV